MERITNSELMIRAFQSYDVDTLKRIHARFFSDEFAFPDFLNGWLCAFVVEDESGIITAGGVRNIVELVTLTDKDRLPVLRRQALYKILEAACFVAGHEKHHELHAFVQGQHWTRRMIKEGFKPTKGTSLVMELNNGKR